METWRPVAGFEGSYEVSDLGRVRSLDRVVLTVDGRTCRYRGRILAISRLAAGWRTVNFSIGNAHSLHFVHDLVLDAFVGRRPAGTEIGFKDGDPANVALTNLSWMASDFGSPSTLEKMIRRPSALANHSRSNRRATPP